MENEGAGTFQEVPAVVENDGKQGCGEPAFKSTPAQMWGTCLAAAAALGADDGAPLVLVGCQLSIVSLLEGHNVHLCEKKPTCNSLYRQRRPPDFGQKWLHNKTGGASCSKGSKGKAQQNDHCVTHYKLGSYPRDIYRMLDVVEVLVGNIVSQSGRILYSGVRGNQAGRNFRSETLGNG